MSKTAIAPLPLVLLLLIWWRRRKISLGDIARTLPFFVAALALGLITVWFEQHQSAGVPARADSLLSRLATAGCAVWFYLYKLILPVHLISVYQLWQTPTSHLTSYFPCLILVLALALFWRRRGTWGRPCLFASAYFVVMLLPALGFINIHFMHVALVADRRQYFAMLGPIALAAAMISPRAKVQSQTSDAAVQTPSPDGQKTGPNTRDSDNASNSTTTTPALTPESGGLHPAFLALASLLVLALSGMTWRQNRVYAEPEAQWRATLRLDPNCWRAENYLGTALEDKGKLDEAIPHYIRAAQMELPGLRPAYEENHRKLIFYHLYGDALLKKGLVEEAIAQYKNALAINPQLAEAHISLVCCNSSGFTMGMVSNEFIFERSDCKGLGVT